ncbi:MAG: 1-acyl-sn-glycerol-3-phosphate acyltransferase [Bacteroidetes bacterium]|nr:1-acyl-sn-glycerol-3-phosphate acyltransferase [Bacteroidota bacterium]
MIPHGTILAQRDRYDTPPDRRVSRLPSTLAFYINAIRVVFSASHRAKRGRYNDTEWVDSSLDIINALEYAGCRLHIEGMEHIRALEGPAVFVSNHMSTLETFVLPALINPVRRCTFVIKPSLMDYPVFGPVMRSRDPIVVTRDNPRKDLLTVLEEGARRLAAGTSIVLFPQTTRSNSFDPSKFNSLGAKLAKNAGVPLLPVALKTDAWSNGNLLKDFGPIRPDLPIHFRFAPPMPVDGNGRAQHEAAAAFISDHLAAWSAG